LSSVDNSRKQDIIIREMTVADLPRVVYLEKLIFPDPWPESAFVEQITETGWGALTAVADDMAVGYGCYYIVADEAHLTNIAVDPAYRRKSVASRLLERILQVAQENQCEYLLLEVRAGNIEARVFYERYGFTLLYRRPKYYRHPVEDALVMVRYLGQKKEKS
jgi:ribosomal-protein-alanine N-acetyltransferase